MKKHLKLIFTLLLTLNLLFTVVYSTGYDYYNDEVSPKDKNSEDNNDNFLDPSNEDIVDESGNDISSDPGDESNIDENNNDDSSDPDDEDITQNPKVEYLIDKLNKKNLWSTKTIYLTFDDGPSRLTESVLNILKKNNIKATFFVIGNNSDYSETLLKRIVNEGHSLGNHTYSHDYSSIYNYSDSFFKDLYKNEEYIYSITGIKPKIVRLPGGSKNNVHKQYTKEEHIMMTICNKLERRGYAYFDWNSTGGDASPIPATVEQIIENSLRGISRNNNAVVLFHDTASKANTLKALPILIEKLKFLGVKFKALNKDSPKVQFLKTTNIDSPKKIENKDFVIERKSYYISKYTILESF